MVKWWLALGAALGCVQGLVGCCKLGGGGGGSNQDGGAVAVTAGPEDEEKAVASGKFAGATLGDFEKRAKKAGWEVLSSSSEDLGGITDMHLELDNKKYYAYVTVVDVSGAQKDPSKFAVQMGADRALVLEVEGLEGGAKPADLLAKVLAKSPLETATRETLTGALNALGWKVRDTSSETSDGLSTSTFSADENIKDETASLEGTFYDWSDAKKENRTAVDGPRLMNVFVCKDCNNRKTKFTSQIWQNLKAKTLLGKLTNP